MTDSLSLLRRRQIQGSRECAEATAFLLQRVIGSLDNHDVSSLLESVQALGRRLEAASPKELAIGNVVRRVLGLIREEVEEDRENGSNGATEEPSSSSPVTVRPESYASSSLDPTTGQQASASTTSETTQPPPAGRMQTSLGNAGSGSMFSLLSQSTSTSKSANTLAFQSPSLHVTTPTEPISNNVNTRDLRAEVLEGLEELLDEIRQADDQIAGYALEHIHSREIILINSTSRTVQKFLLKAAAKRKYTVVQAANQSDGQICSYQTPSARPPSKMTAQGPFISSLTAAGISVIVVPDSAVFALMARINKVVIDASFILADGSFVAPAGSLAIAKAAKLHKNPIVALGGVYKISPIYPFTARAFLETGDTNEVTILGRQDLMKECAVQNPLSDYLSVGLVDLYISNLGGLVPASIYQVVSDHYRMEDLDLGGMKPEA